MTVTCHRNKMGLKAYSDVDVGEHKKISSILSNQSSQLLTIFLSALYTTYTYL